MTTLEIKKHIIKDIITPFFKNNGFIKKGVKYFKDIDRFKITVNIQSLKYHKTDNAEEFRINVKIILENTDEIIRYLFIPSNTSHITIDDNINIEELKLSISNDLSNLLKTLQKYNNIEEIIKEQLEKIELLEGIIVEKKKLLEQETTNQNLIYILRNEIERYTDSVNIINNWIKECKSPARANL